MGVSSEVGTQILIRHVHTARASGRMTCNKPIAEIGASYARTWACHPTPLALQTGKK
jgi:hypothetical protein